jgi:hypothetical protein
MRFVAVEEHRLDLAPAVRESIAHGTADTLLRLH